MAEAVMELGRFGLTLSLYPDRIEKKAAGTRESIPLTKVNAVNLEHVGMLWKLHVVTSGSTIEFYPVKRQQGEAFRDKFYELTA